MPFDFFKRSQSNFLQNVSSSSSVTTIFGRPGLDPLDPLRLADLEKAERIEVRSPLGDRPIDPDRLLETGMPDGLVGTGIPDLRFWISESLSLLLIPLAGLKVENLSDRTLGFAPDVDPPEGCLFLPFGVTGSGSPIP